MKFQYFKSIYIIITKKHMDSHIYEFMMGFLNIECDDDTNDETNNNKTNNNNNDESNNDYTNKYNNILEKLYDNTLTKKIYLEPVLADDGEIYEKSALLKHLRDNNHISPKYPNMKISKNIIKVNIISSLINLFLDHKPELKEHMYVKQQDEFYMDYDELNNILGNNNRISEILKYKQIELDCLNVKALKKFLCGNNVDVQKYFIDNVSNLDCPIVIESSIDYLINIIISCENYKLVEYIIGKININCTRPSSNETPLHILVKNHSSKSNLILHMVNSGADLSIKNSNGHSVLNYLMNFCKVEVVECILYYCVDLDSENKSQNINHLYNNNNIATEEKENLVTQLF